MRLRGEKSLERSVLPMSLFTYIMTGMPMHLVYGCNKFAAACGTSIATLRYWRHKMVEIPVGLSAAAGSFCCLS